MEEPANYNLEEINKYSLTQLYQLLDKAEYFEGLGVAPDPNLGDEKRGRNRFQAMMRRFRKKICDSDKFQSLFSEQKNLNRLQIAAVIADILTSHVTPFAAFTFGLIVSKTAYTEICK